MRKYGDKVIYNIRLRFFRRHECLVAFRVDPVPYTGKRRPFRYYRHPKTTQERRWAEAYGKYVRGRRRGKYLPNTYDDLPRGDLKDKGWKRRSKVKKQWMKNLK